MSAHFLRALRAKPENLCSHADNDNQGIEHIRLKNCFKLLQVANRRVDLVRDAVSENNKSKHQGQHMDWGIGLCEPNTFTGLFGSHN